MNDQRRILVVVSAVLASVLVAYFGYQRFLVRPLAEKESQRKSVEKAVGDLELKLKTAKQEASALEELTKRCLPGEESIAQENYTSYLSKLFQDAGIAPPEISRETPQRPAPGLLVVRCSTEVHTDMESLLRLWHEFYSSPRLQQITDLTLTPLDRKAIASPNSESTNKIGGAAEPDKGPQTLKPSEAEPLLRVSMKMEAIALGDGYRPEESTFQSTIAAFEQYRSLVQESNLFAESPGTFLRANDPEYVRFSSIVGGVEADALVEAELHDRAKNEYRKVRMGDTFLIGDARALILDMGLNDMVLLIDGNLYQWKLGQFFSARSPLSAEDALGREILKAHRRKAM